MTNFRPIFEGDYCGIDNFLKEVLSPVFGEYEQGYDVLTNDSDVREKANNANIIEIRHAATFDFFGSELKVFDITVGDNKKLENNKVGIQVIVRQYINQFEGALIIFHHKNVENQEWRFSYVEKRINAKDSTSAKRYTYILGKGHPARTIAERFNDLESKKDKDEAILLPALTKAFSVAPLSDDFFNEYREHYADLVEYISGKRFVKKGGKFVEEKTKNANGAFKSAFDGDDKLVRDFVKKMMGRLVFLHFLQKKGWLGVPENAEWGSGDKNFIYNLFKNADESIKADFLEQALEPLFFKTLNTDRGEDALAPKVLCDIYGSKIRIPYLNGGLFEEDELDKKKVKFKKEHFENLLEFFSQYNFTIDETDPDDKEIGVDPEMLGKIFENLLEDNKDKGAFYTPKEIVHYMCRESLIAYLESYSKRDVSPTAQHDGVRPSEQDSHSEHSEESKIRNFVLHHAISDFSEGEKAALLKALLDVKICDPAVGSGAFPMGMLNELLACMQALLHGKTDVSPAAQHDGVCLSEQASHSEEAQATEESLSRSQLKKHIVKNNIYGVDIEKGAVDIARLRFWLAIIVDEKEPIPLPNLDYKIMQGNSLLESFEGEDLSCLTKTNGTLFDNAEIIKQLTDAINGFYIPSDHIAKAKIRRQISEKVLQLLKERQIAPEKLKKLESIDLHSNSEFFLWHTWFSDVFNRPNDCNGFDIVIGNPPYISAPTQIANKKLSEQRERIIDSKKYRSLYQKWDLYIPFIELGTQLNCKNGITTMIVPFPLTNQLYAKVLRKMLVEENNMFELVDLNGTKIFDNATVSNCIPFIQKRDVSPSAQHDTSRHSERSEESTWISKIDENLHISRAFEQTKSALVQDEKNYVWNVTQEKRETNRHADMHVLGDYCYISEGMKLNADEKIARGEFKKEDLISLVKDEKHPREYYEGKDIEKYFFKNKPRYLEYDTDRVPAKLRRPTFSELYSNPKLMFNILGDMRCVYDINKILHSTSIISAVLWKELHDVENKSIASSIKKFSTMSREKMEELSESVDLRYLLGVMNSKYASVLLTNNRGDDYHIYAEHIRNIPIPNATPKQQQPIIALVDKILAAKKANPQADTSTEEAEIDELVYDFYGLTGDEKDIIRGK